MYIKSGVFKFGPPPLLGLHQCSCSLCLFAVCRTARSRLGMRLGGVASLRTASFNFHDGSDQRFQPVSWRRNPCLAPHYDAGVEPNLLFSHVPHELHGQLKDTKGMKIFKMQSKGRDTAHSSTPCMPCLATFPLHKEGKPLVTPYLLTPWLRVLLEKLTGLQLVKKFPAFYGTRRFITALTSVRHLSLSWEVGCIYGLNMWNRVTGWLRYFGSMRRTRGV